MTGFYTWSSAGPPSARPNRWILASELWAETKADRARILKPSLAWMRRAKRINTVERATRETLRLAKLQQPLAAVLAAWVSLCPLAPQQAKREAVIAVGPVHVVDELVSRQRAAEQASRWGFGR